MLAFFTTSFQRATSFSKRSQYSSGFEYAGVYGGKQRNRSLRQS